MLNDRNVSQIAREYKYLSCLFDAQPTMTQAFLEKQARAMIVALRQKKCRIHFQLPEKITLEEGGFLKLPPTPRSQAVGSNLISFSSTNRHTKLIQHLNRLEQSLNPGLSVCGKLMRFTLAHHMVYNLLPDKSTACYEPARDNNLPSIEVNGIHPSTLFPESDRTAEIKQIPSNMRHQQVPNVALAERFSLPYWVAFEKDEQLLSTPLKEAEILLDSLQNAFHILQEAEVICPSVVADETYQRKRAELFSQLINQGHTLVSFYTQKIIAKIHFRAETGSLNRGLRLSLPYFEIEDMAIRIYPVNIIPEGRIIFTPALVVRAMRSAQMKVIRDIKISPSSRQQLLVQLTHIENTFDRYFSQE
jgi:hypothetical protein